MAKMKREILSKGRGGRELSVSSREKELAPGSTQGQPAALTRPHQPLVNGHRLSFPPVKLGEAIPAPPCWEDLANLRDSGGESEEW